MIPVENCAVLQRFSTLIKSRLFSDIYITEGNTAAVRDSHCDCKERIL